MNWRGKTLRRCEVTRLPILEPLVRLAAGEDPKVQLAGIAKCILLPALAVLMFVGFWSASAEQQAIVLSNAELLNSRGLQAANRTPSGPPIFARQIQTSIKTVFLGFAMATLIAVPLGILCGMIPWSHAVADPFIQIFKPVSPLVWLPVAFIVVIWYYAGTTEGTYLQESFSISAATVTMCSLWPTLVSTTLGVASVDKRYLNVARVLRLSRWQKLYKIILPASLPLVLAGMRISLAIGWMVLIAADMLPQNPGLGKFAWDGFQSGSNMTYARIAFSVITIGLIGLLLDRMMVCLRNRVSFGDPSAA